MKPRLMQIFTIPPGNTYFTCLKYSIYQCYKFCHLINTKKRRNNFKRVGDLRIEVNFRKGGRNRYDFFAKLDLNHSIKVLLQSS